MRLRAFVVAFVATVFVAIWSGSSHAGTSVDFNAGSPDSATLSAIDQQETPILGSTPSSPQQYESVDIANFDPCQDVTNLVTTFDYTTCFAVTPTFGNEAPTPQDARQMVINYVRSMQLPSPQPEISAPNGGICGVVHTMNLHIDDVNPAFYDPTTDFGPMVVRFHGKFTVDWGDGSKSVYRTAGGPYPSVISHSWTDRGYYDINVTADWTAEWSLGQFAGVVGGFRTNGDISQWRVWEAQAMLVS